jgi:diphosphomevalonate decarboxylase
MTQSSTAIAHPNIAFIKYWGNKNHELRIPSTDSISMNLGNLTTRTTVVFDKKIKNDRLTLNGEKIKGIGLDRVTNLLDKVREMSQISFYADVTSENTFPMGSGIASSASGFAALSLAATSAAGLSLAEIELSRIARVGSGSASRSIPSGFVEWYQGTDHESSFSESIALPDHWALVDCIAVIGYAHKAISSADGHMIADTSPLQKVRVSDAPRRMDICRQAILNRDFLQFAEIVELDSNMMHAVMMTSSPNLIYLEPASLAIMQAVKTWRANEGLELCYTIDAGPNVHVICKEEISSEVIDRLRQIPGVQEVMKSHPGGSAKLL